MDDRQALTPYLIVKGAARAIEFYQVLLRAVKDEFCGDRAGMLVDPFGHRWHVATHKTDVTTDEMQKRWSATMDGGV